MMRHPANANRVSLIPLFHLSSIRFFILSFMTLFLSFAHANSSFADNTQDLGRMALLCYHPTGEFRRAEMIEEYWDEAERYDAAFGFVIRVYWNGAFSKNPYETDVGVLVRKRYERTQLRTVLLSDNALIPGGLTCPTERNWMNVDGD